MQFMLPLIDLFSQIIIVRHCYKLAFTSHHNEKLDAWGIILIYKSSFLNLLVSAEDIYMHVDHTSKRQMAHMRHLSGSRVHI